MIPEQAAAYAAQLACLAEPMRIRLLHAVATARRPMSVGALTGVLGISQPTCSHHVRRLTEAGLVKVRRASGTTFVSVDTSCCASLPHPADAIMGMLARRPCRSDDQLPADVSVRAMLAKDWDAVLRIYREGIATGQATFETEVPDRAALDGRWLRGHRWIAEVDDRVAGWAALTPTSTRPCYAGVAETSVYVGDGFRGRGVGRALIHRQTSAADAAALWTLQASIFPENLASIGLHRSAGFRTVGIRERIARHHGTWRDTVILERRAGGG